MVEFEVTVLGKYSPFPPKDGACSGYLVKGGSDYLLLDVGNGVLSRLQRYIDITDLKGVLLSHHHPDHKADIHSLRHAWSINMRKGNINTPLKIYMPDEPRYEVKQLENYKNIFSVIRLQAGLDYPFDPFLIEWLETNHPMKCAAFAIKYNGKKIVYTGDGSLSPRSELFKLCENADLLLCESSLMEEDKGTVPGHMSTKDAANLAKKAGVKKLILTHFWPFYEEENLLGEAREVFDDTHLAIEGKTYIA